MFMINSLTKLRCYLAISIPLNIVMFFKESLYSFFRLWYSQYSPFLFVFAVILDDKNKKKVMNYDLCLIKVGFFINMLMIF